MDGTDVMIHTAHATARPNDAVIAEDVPAKINLSLHVVGRRADGYHLLDSLVAFTIDAYDRVTVRFGNGPTKLTMDGPYASMLPTGDDNAVLAAAKAVGGVAAVHLHKGLPVASGLGGGSADAAAVLRIAQRVRCGADLAGVAQRLGADVPVCAHGQACRMRGIGEALDTVPMPAMPVVLINPLTPVSTRAVFQRLAKRDNGALPEPCSSADPAGLIDALVASRNDLEAAACAEAPVIVDVLAALRCAPGCLFARMSGSGASVFGLFTDESMASAAATHLSATTPWWVRASTLRPSPG